MLTVWHPREMEEGVKQTGIDGSEKQAEVADNSVEKFAVVIVMKRLDTPTLEGCRGKRK